MNTITRFTKLTAPENRGTYKIESIAKTKEEIAFLCRELVLKTVFGAFSIGERLVAMKAQLEHGKFLKYLEKEFPYSHKTARQYMLLYERFKDDPGELEKFGLKEALIWAGIIKPKEVMECAEGYNRIDLGGDPGQLRLDYSELFELPAVGNKSLKNYRTIAALLSEIIVVRRLNDGGLISKRFVQFCEDIPQDSVCKNAYKTMALETQASIEKYLAVVEQVAEGGNITGLPKRKRKY
jgi:hypothetical protein